MQMLAAIYQIKFHYLKKPRTKISEDVEAEILFRSNRQCCVDQKRGDHIHHIDSNPSNSNIQNLALLCFDCHNEASMKGSLRKKLTPKTILKFREHHYKTIQSQRAIFIKKLNHPIQKLATEDLLNAAKDAIIILEIEKLKIDYFNQNWGERSEILDKFDAYENHNNPRIAYEILAFLVRVTYGTRGHMPTDIASKIYFLVCSFLVLQKNKAKNNERFELGVEALQIALNMFYDSVIHLRNLRIAQWALLLTKHIYWYSKNEKLNALTEKVYENFKEYERHMIRPGRNDLDNAKRLISLYKDDLPINQLTFANLPEDLYDAVESSDPLNRR
jgi:hypothetical protein